MVAFSMAYSSSSRTPQPFKFFSSGSCLYSFEQFSTSLAGLLTLVLDRGVDCCDSWLHVSFADRAAVMASVRRGGWWGETPRLRWVLAFLAGNRLPETGQCWGGVLD